MDHPFPAALAACALAACLATTLVATNRRRWQPGSAADPGSAAAPAGTAAATDAVPPTLEQRIRAVLRADTGSLGLPDTFVRDLLRGDGPQGQQGGSVVVLHRPFVATLAAQLEQCAASGAWPELPQLQNGELAALELDTSTDRARWTLLVHTFLASQVGGLLSGLGTKGIASLLGQRSTAGSATAALPPSRPELTAAFDLLHKAGVPGCALTVGARALAKHIHRGEESWWSIAAGVGTRGLTGGDSEKSRWCAQMMNFVLKTRNYVSNTMNLVSKTMNYVLKLMNCAAPAQP